MNNNNIEAQIGITRRILRLFLSSRAERFAEFREFHKNAIELMGPDLAKAVGLIRGVCKNKPDYAVEFTVKDYAWWGTIDPTECNLISLDKLKMELTKKLQSVIEQCDSDVITMELADEIAKAFK